MADENIKISLFPNAPLAGGEHKRVRWFSYILTTARVNYGTKYANENFKLSLQDLREDFTGYIGLKNIQPPWTDCIDLWRGYWYKAIEDPGPGGETLLSTDKVASYTYEWKPSEREMDGYIADKFKRGGVYFIIDAPFPCEEPTDVETD